MQTVCPCFLTYTHACSQKPIHADRTPKQKLKLKVSNPELLAMFHRNKDSKGKQVRMGLLCVGLA